MHKTSTHRAPWHLIPANDKPFARVRRASHHCRPPVEVRVAVSAAARPQGARGGGRSCSESGPGQSQARQESGAGEPGLRRLSRAKAGAVEEKRASRGLAFMGRLLRSHTQDTAPSEKAASFHGVQGGSSSMAGDGVSDPPFERAAGEGEPAAGSVRTPEEQQAALSHASDRNLAACADDRDFRCDLGGQSCVALGPLPAGLRGSRHDRRLRRLVRGGGAVPPSARPADPHTAIVPRNRNASAARSAASSPTTFSRRASWPSA